MLFNQLSQGCLQVVGGVTWHDLKHNRLTEDLAWSDVILWRVNQTLCCVASEVWFMGLPTWWRVSRWYCTVSNCYEIWTPPDVLSVYSPFWGAYFWRGLSTEGNLRFKIDWASLTVESKSFLLCFSLYLGAIFQIQAPRGGLIFGGAYTRRGLFSEFYGRPFSSCPSPCFKKIWTE